MSLFWFLVLFFLGITALVLIGYYLVVKEFYWGDKDGPPGE